jgi:hypothetical protein
MLRFAPMTGSGTPPTSPGGNAARDALRREMYWAEEATPIGRLQTAEVRDQLHDFAALMRADEREPIPRGEPNLASVSRWRRQLKLRLFRLFRPVSWRYDRLLADHAELTTALAERVQAAEAEAARLRAILEERERSPEGRA